MMAMQTENGLSFLSRVSAKPVNDLGKDLFIRSLNPPELIEISGEAGVGKSLLCLDLMATALLPKMMFSISLGGAETGVLFIDCDQHFSILRFTDLLERKIKKKCHEKRKELRKQGAKESNAEILSISKKDFNSKIQQAVKNCLKNFFYFNCSNSNQFAVTLLTLGQSLANKSIVSVIFVDSISTYYWYDRIYKTDNWHKMELYLNNLFRTFIDFIKKNYLICISTKQSLFKKQDDFESFANVCESPKFTEFCTYDFLGKEWNSSLTCKVNMKFQCEQNFNSDSEINDKDSFCVVETLREGVTKVSYCTFHDDGLHWFSKNL